MLKEILDAREERWNKKLELLKRFNYPVLSFMLNIPGSCKTKPLYIRAHRALLEEFKTNLSSNILYEEVFTSADGPCALFVVNEDSKKLKKLAMQFEEVGLGRICDIDVMEQCGKLLSRDEMGIPMRKCYVCGGAAKECIAGKKHSLEEVVSTFNAILEKNLNT